MTTAKEIFEYFQSESLRLSGDCDGKLSEVVAEALEHVCASWLAQCSAEDLAAVTELAIRYRRQAEERANAKIN